MLSAGKVLQKMVNKPTDHCNMVLPLTDFVGLRSFQTINVGHL